MESKKRAEATLDPPDDKRRTRPLGVDSLSVGRDRELEELRRTLLGRDACVLVVGPPGVGKTHLASHIADRWGEIGGGRVHWLDASSIDDGPAMTSALALRLGIDSSDRDQEALEEALGEVIRVRRDDLIVIDEWRADPTTHRTLNGLFDRPHRASVLVTTPYRSDLVDCEVLEVEPLDIDSAVDLIKACAYFPVADLDAPDARPALERLAEAVDGLPLALRWVASHLNVWRPDELCDRVDDALRTTGRESDDASRSLELVWTTLPKSVRANVEVLSLFADGLTAEAAVAMTGEDAASAIFEPLARRHLLRRIPAEDGARFELLEAFRAFVSGRIERRERSRRRAELERRFVDYFARWARRKRQQFYSANAHKTRAKLLAERVNLKRAFGLAMRHGSLAEAVDLAIALGRLVEYVATDHLMPIVEFATETAAELDSKRRLADALLARALVEDKEDRSRGFARCEEAVEIVANCETSGLSLEIGLLRIRLGAREVDDDTLWSWCDELEAELDDVDEPIFDGLLALTRGDIEDRRRRWNEARDHFEEALVTLRTHAEPGVQADAHDSMGVLEAQLGRLNAAEFHFRQARQLHQKANQRRSATIALEHLATVAYERQQFDDALVRQREAIASHRRLGNRRYLGSALVSLVFMELAAGDRQQAEETSRRAILICRQTGDDPYLGIAHGCLGSVLLVNGAAQRAEEHLRRAIALTGEHNQPAFACRFLGLLIARQAMNLEMSKARQEFEELRTRIHQLELPPLQAMLGYVEEIVELGQLRNSASPDRCTSLTAERSEPTDSELKADQFIFADLLAEQRRMLEESDTDDGATLLRIGHDRRWFECDGKRVDLSRRDALSRILEALADRHINRSAAPITIEELIEVGWPQETVTPESARNRVYTAIRRLRDMGLRGVLRTGSQGYFLDNDYRVEFVKGP